MKVFAKFDEIPSMTLQDINETKRHGHTFVRSDGQHENSLSSHKHSLRGYNNFAKILLKVVGVQQKHVQDTHEKCHGKGKMILLSFSINNLCFNVHDVEFCHKYMYLASITIFRTYTVMEP